MPKAGMYCANYYCAIGCADGDIEYRLSSYYKADTDEQRIDFNFCHPLWQKHYITIQPPSQAHKVRYMFIGSTAAVINVLSLLTGFYFIYKLAEEKGVTDEVLTVYDSKSKRAKIRTTLKYFLVLAPIMVQVMDSLLDATYFIKLKTDIRIIQVQPYIQVAQAFLLFTCKFRIQLESTTQF